MTAPVVYHSTDAGAPTPANVNDAIYDILLACLVNGYGAKPAAGWAVVYDAWQSDGMLSLTNADQTGVIGFVRGTSSSVGCSLFVADAMVDATSAVNARSGKIARTSLTDLESQSDCHQCLYSNTHTHWCVVANDNFAMLFHGNTQARLYSISDAGSWTSGGFLMFGAGADVRNGGGLGNFFVIGGFERGRASQGFLNSNWVTVLYDTNGAFNSTATLTGFVVPYQATAANYGTGVLDYVDLILHPADIYLSESTNIFYARQHVRVPMLLANDLMAGNYSRQLMQPLFAERFKDAQLIAGRSCILGSEISGVRRFLISMIAADWP